MLIVVFPGQGAQAPGMLAPWLALPGVAEQVGGWSAAAGVDLVEAGTTAGRDALRDTAVAQPVLAALALVSAGAALGEAVPGAVCGHSVGELPALAVAGVLAADEVVRLAGLRGRLMAEASAAAPSGMAAVLGGLRDDVVTRAAAAGLSVATVNGSAQVVVGGPLAALDAFTADPPPGSRVRRLDVAGAFHTDAMAPAAGGFASALAALRPTPALCPVLANADGAAVTEGAALLARLVTQLTGPVRFDRCVEAMAALGVTGVLEVAPGGTLAPLLTRALPGAEVVALRSPEDLDTARALVAAHAAAGPEQPDVDFSLVSSPESGIVDLLLTTGAHCRPGQPVAVVSARSGSLHIGAPAGGLLREWLVSPGDPVRAGQPLAVLA